MLNLLVQEDSCLSIVRSLLPDMYAHSRTQCRAAFKGPCNSCGKVRSVAVKTDTQTHWLDSESVFAAAHCT